MNSKSFETEATRLASCNSKKMQVLGILRQLRDQLDNVSKGFTKSSEGQHYLRKVDIAIRALTATSTPKVDRDTTLEVNPRGEDQKADMAKLDALLEELRTCEELLDLGK